MKKKLILILVSIITFLGIPGVICFFVGLNSNGSGRFIVLTVGICLLIPFFIMLCILFIAANRKKKTDQKEHEKFKQEAFKVKVNIEDFTIKHNSWTDETIVESGQIGGFNQMSGNADKNIKYVTQNQNLVCFRISLEGKIIEHQVYLNKDPKAIEMLIIMQKETYLYIDKVDTNKKYLDLEFLG